ncbi:41243_t:CDS:2, partial [Gigaspora margarita]
DLENSINSTLYYYNTKLVWSKAASIIGTNKYKNIGARKNSLRESLSDKTNASSSTQRITEVGKQTYSLFSSEKRPQSDSRSSSKERSKPNKSVNLGSKAKYTGKENISQTNLLQEILERLNHLEISQKKDFFDSYRLANPNAYILDMDVCTESDHNLAAASFNMHGLISKILLALNYKKQDRQVFEYKKANKKNWEQYQEDLYNFLFKRSSLKILEPDQVKTSPLTQTAIDKIWKSFKDGIIFAAKKNIPFKIVKGSQPDYKVKHKSKEKKGRSILHTSTKLTKIYKTSEFIDSRTLLESNQIILEANTKLDTQIQALSSTINKEWLDVLKDGENVNEVKRRTQQHFQTQYQNRNTTNEKVTEDWEQIYVPKKEIKDK